MRPLPGVEQDALVTSAGRTGLDDVYREYGPDLWRALVAYAGDRDVADEALAEAFAQAAARGSAIRAPERWVWTAAFRIAAGQLKERRAANPRADPAVLTDATETIDLLAALARLPPKQRAALVLHYYGGYKAREIAHILGSSAATVRVHLSAGRRRLRTLLEVDDD
jgi:RNA polymerase sigma-70 factor (ECF subfamily)